MVSNYRITDFSDGSPNFALMGTFSCSAFWAILWHHNVKIYKRIWGVQWSVVAIFLWLIKLIFLDNRFLCSNLSGDQQHFLADQVSEQILLIWWLLSYLVHSWIGSVQLFLGLSFGILSGRTFDAGYLWVLSPYLITFWTQKLIATILWLVDLYWWFSVFSWFL